MNEKKIECKACAKTKFVKENPDAMVNCRAEVHTCQRAEFIYRSPASVNSPIAQNATLGVKFAEGIRLLDPWHIMGGTKRTRMLFRLKHPIVYGKRGLRSLFRRIKRIFIKDRMIYCIPRVWKSKEELFHIYPKKKDENGQTTRHV